MYFYSKKQIVNHVYIFFEHAQGEKHTIVASRFFFMSSVTTLVVSYSAWMSLKIFLFSSKSSADISTRVTSLVSFSGAEGR